MRQTQQKSLRSVILPLLLILMGQTAASQDLSSKGRTSESQMKRIPFNVVAGVVVGGASIGIIEPVLEVGGVPLNIPAIVFPPDDDGFVTQSITLPSDLRVNQPLFVEVLFSGETNAPSTTQATARLSLLFFASLTEPVGSISGTGGEQERFVEVTGSLKKATFGIPINQIIAQADVLTIQIGRRARNSAQDTYPGVVRVEAVRISYMPQ